MLIHAVPNFQTDPHGALMCIGHIYVDDSTPCMQLFGFVLKLISNPAYSMAV